MLSLESIEKAINDFNKKSINLSSISEKVIRLDTPFYNRHNDTIIIYIQELKNGHIKITDAGYTLDDLESDGIFINKSKNKVNIMLRQLKSFAVNLDKNTNELYIESSIADYAVNQNLLIQAVLFVNDMFLLSNKRVASIFLSEVAGFLEDNNIRSVTNRNIIGATGMVHHFDFSIPGFKNIPERLIRVMNSSNNEYYAKSIAMDMRQAKEVIPETSFYAFINDDSKVDEKVINLFEFEGIKPVLFSKKSEYIKELAE